MEHNTEFITKDGLKLKLNKTYRWSGYDEGLYTSINWKDLKCKVTKIEGDHVYIYDYYYKEEQKYTKEELWERGITFRTYTDVLKDLISRIWEY